MECHSDIKSNYLLIIRFKIQSEISQTFQKFTKKILLTN